MISYIVLNPLSVKCHVSLSNHIASQSSFDTEFCHRVECITSIMIIDLFRLLLVSTLLIALPAIPRECRFSNNREILVSHWGTSKVC